MLNIGCHLSVSKGFLNMGKTASLIGADTFQFFTRNPRGGAAKDLDEADINEYNEYAAAHNFAKIVAHAPYTLNACSNNPQTRDFALRAFADDLKRMEYIPDNYYNFHPGSHMGQGVQKGVEMIACLLNRILQREQTTTVLLETMSGKGSETGSRFEELAEIINKTNLNDKVGVCMDTCHIFAAGYDIVNDLDGVFAEFDKVIGLNRLKAIHLNDSLMPFASHKDRHARIGEGFIGKEVLFRFINHQAVNGLPFILETPNELEGYAEEIKMLKNNYNRKTNLT